MAENVLSRLAVVFSADTTKLDQGLKSSQRNVSNFSSAIKGTLAGIGVSLTFAAAIGATKEYARVLAEFESTMSEVKAITGATGDEFTALSNDALRLGASTKFTAREVGQLQIAYGRLGFTNKEILQATEATLQLATATGEDLAKSADVAGSTVRGFGLQADETQRVVDVMASSFNKTALGLDNFTESMKYVAPVASAAGATVEETTALLGVLADAGIRGSMAGTSLRKIFTDITKDGRPLMDRLNELGKRGITLADSFDEVGRTAQTSLLILANNTDKVARLSGEFKNVSGEAERVSRIMRDNLSGDVEKLASAWEGLILRVGNSEIFRVFTQAATALIAGISNAPAQVDDALDGFARVIKNTGDKLNREDPLFATLVEKLKEVRREAGRPIDTKAVEFFAEKYKLTSDQANVLFQAIVQANKALSFQEYVIKKLNDINAAKGYDDITKAAEDYKNEIYAARFQLQLLQEEQKKVGSTAGVAKAQTDLERYDREIRIINEYIEAIQTRAKKDVEANKISFESLDSLEEKIKTLKAEIEAAPTSNIPFIQELDKRLKETESRVEYIKQLIRGFKISDLKYVAPTSDVALNLEDPADLFPSEEIHKQIEESIMLEQALRDAEKALYDFLITQEGFAGYSKAFEGMTTDIAEEIEINLTPVLQSALSGIGQAFGTAIAGTENFGDSLLKVLGNVLVQLGEMAITTGLGVEAIKASLESLNGAVAIAAGIALIALGSAVTASVSNLGSNPTGGASGGNSAAAARQREKESRFDQNEFEIKIGGEFKINGSDLVTVINKQEKINGRTRG